MLASTELIPILIRMRSSKPNPSNLALPDADAVIVGAASATLVSVDGEIETLSPGELAERLDGPPLLMCHARSVARRTGRDWVAGFDVLELFAFVHPAKFCRPTPQGLCEPLGLKIPDDSAGLALALRSIAGQLLVDLAGQGDERSDPLAIAWTMGQGGWPWAPFVLAALDAPAGPTPARSRRALEIWHGLPEWQGDAPPPPPSSQPVSATEARQRLGKLRGTDAEERPQQADYASAVAQAFDPKPAEDAPIAVLAEAGTGVGKTLGYLAPATVWAEKNGAPVWISTFTRNLQHQIDQELDRLVLDPTDKARRVVIRKGRENYLCLLNLEDAARALPTQPQTATALGLMARWAASTRDGDLQGGDFPGWLSDLIGRGRSMGLADRRGECIYSACSHYQKCFIERSVRRARRAEIVIANHALVMIQAALGGIDDQYVPTRLIFDEGHHLFDAADGAFSGHLTARETAELRRWLIGSQVARRSRARGLRRRIEDLIGDETEALEQLDEIERAARALPAEAWATRLRAGEDGADENGKALTDDGLHGAAERFLALVRQQVYARASGRDGPYNLETDAVPPIDGIDTEAVSLRAQLVRLQAPMKSLARTLKRRLEDEAESLDTNTRQRLEASARGLERRAMVEVGTWIAMLDALAGTTPDDVVDWFGVERIEGRDIDVGYYRHYLDPTRPLAATLAGPTHGMVVTSATLTDSSGDIEQDWEGAEARTGAIHLAQPAIRARVPSPFDYPKQTRVLIVRDVRKDDMDQVAAAYRALIEAADGGTLGLFTAISRLRAVHRRLAPALEASGLPLFAQHVDGMDVSTLVDIFRGEEQASLLGTDAVRDGVDVPGRSLRLIVFDRVPWPRPSILQRARAEYFGKQRYTDMLTRLRLKQAFGRLVRRADDRGVFVLLDPMMPTRLTGAFPDGVEVERLGLAEAVQITRSFLSEMGNVSE
ncbi:MAG: ATP-dependent DNA helicase [Pseudomonadota bacterium]